MTLGLIRHWTSRNTSTGHFEMSSAGQELIQAGRKTATICQQERSSYPGGNGAIQDRLDSQRNRHCRGEDDEKTATESCGNACMPAGEDKNAEENLGASGDCA